MSIQVTVDLETLSTRHDGMIISIGAVKHDDRQIIDSFHVAIDPKDAERYGRHISAGTTLWWLDEERADARRSWLKQSQLDMDSALDGFAKWFGLESLPVWGNGATFDNVLLRSSFDAVGIPCPWGHWHDRCYRTLKNMAPSIPLVREGVHHNAVDDAMSQAKHLQAIVQALGIML